MAAADGRLRRLGLRRRETRRMARGADRRFSRRLDRRPDALAGRGEESMSPAPTSARLCDVSRYLSDADLLLFRREGLLSFSHLISTAGRSEYSHAAMLGHCHGLLLCLEMRELRGGRAVTLESQVRRYPGRIDVFTLRSEYREAFDRFGAVKAMMRRCGGEYSYAGILSAALLHLPGVRLLASPNTDD